VLLLNSGVRILVYGLQLAELLAQISGGWTRSDREIFPISSKDYEIADFVACQLVSRRAGSICGPTFQL
jgi:hypothetical protein